MMILVDEFLSSVGVHACWGEREIQQLCWRRVRAHPRVCYDADTDRHHQHHCHHHYNYKIRRKVKWIVLIWWRCLPACLPAPSPTAGWLADWQSNRQANRQTDTHTHVHFARVKERGKEWFSRCEQFYINPENVNKGLTIINMASRQWDQISKPNIIRSFSNTIRKHFKIYYVIS